MVTRIILVASGRKSPALCDKILDTFSLNRTYFQKYFQAEYVEVSRENEIPMQTQFNLLLSGQAGHTFKDVSEQTEISTAE